MPIPLKRTFAETKESLCCCSNQYGDWVGGVIYELEYEAYNDSTSVEEAFQKEFQTRLKEKYWRLGYKPAIHVVEKVCREFGISPIEIACVILPVKPRSMTY